MPTAVVLSGGGARGDFQIGALSFLYEKGIRPDILCATSVGAINAVKLAEGEDSADPRRGLAGLEALWSGLQKNEDMYLEEDWLHDPDMWPRVRDILVGNTTTLDITAPPESPGVGQILVGDPLWLIDAWGIGKFLVEEGIPLLKSLQVISTRARALFNLRPIVAKLDSDLDLAKVGEWAAQGNQLRLAMVGLESGQLRYVTETGEVIERNGTGVRDLSRVPAACQPLLMAVEELEADIRASQADLSSAAPGEKGFIAAQIRGNQTKLAETRAAFGKCLAENPTGDPLFVDVDVGAWASASIPAIFPPVSIGGENYVDGGIREVLPVQMAVDLGADTIYAIDASRPNLKAAPGTFNRALMSEIAARGAIQIPIDEISRDDRRVTPMEGRDLPEIFNIQPDEDVHDTMTIDPGLIQITRDYGYMRAADVIAHTDPSGRRWQLPTLIGMLRKEIWALENRRWGQLDPTHRGEAPGPPEPALQATLDERKVSLQALVDERRGLSGSMPHDIDIWSGRIERHPWETAFNDARFVAQSAPAPSPSGSLVPVSVTMRNTGTTSWSPTLGYSLGSQNPQDSTTWGTGRVGLPGPVDPGHSVTFAWTATMPQPPRAVFAWRMVRDGVEWFGAFTPPVTVAIPEPPECAGLRDKIRQGEQGIRDLQADLSSAAPGEKGFIGAQIKKMQEEVRRLSTRAVELGCGPTR